MKLLKLLKEVTGKQFPVFSLWKTPRELGLDSLTYTDFITLLEERFGVNYADSEMIELYRTRLIKWLKYPKMREKRHRKT